MSKPICFRTEGNYIVDESASRADAGVYEGYTFPSIDSERYDSLLMAMMSLFCDESGKYQKNPIVTISSVGATNGRLERFNTEWNTLLRSYGISPELHMARAMDLTQDYGTRLQSGISIDERMDKILPFVNCINDNLEIGLAQAWDVTAYSALPWEATRRLGGSRDPHYLAFARALLGIVAYVGKSDHIHVICDDDQIKAWDMYLHYRSVGKVSAEVSQKVTAMTFANSQYYPALQAADMVAFLTRKEAAERFLGTANPHKRLFEYLVSGSRSHGIIRWFSLFVDDKRMIDYANVASQPL